MPACLIGLGSNRGDRASMIALALERVARCAGVERVTRSALRPYAPAGGPSGQQPFLNAAALLETSLPPRALLERLQAIEADLGRRRQERWGPRTIDLDLLLYDRLAIDEPGLTLPHPRMAFRRFVVEPAAEVAPGMVHPQIGWTIARLLEHLDAARPYVALAGGIASGKTAVVRRLAEARGARSIEENVDPKRLAAFYAAPASRGWATELEFLAERTERLAAERPIWNDRQSLVVSDFWFEQSRAFARVWLAPERFEEFDRRLAAARTKVVSPKLVVLLDLPGETLLWRVRRRGRAFEEGLTAERLERIRLAIRAEAAAPGRGPVLRLETDDADAVTAEVLSAVDAMEHKAE
jgi:2-amino-4-hydroxy-6-hydroxymethyldihydropteridine diphosphokinase